MAQVARDFGASRKGGDGVRFNAPVVVACVLAVAVGAAIWSVRQQSSQIAEATADTHAETFVGPPCPTVARGAFRQPLRPSKVFDLDGVRFGRRFGATECSAISRKSLLGNGYQLVCQFPSPAVLAVQTGSGLFYYEPGIGQKATVFVLDGTPRCVLASPFYSEWMREVTETDAIGRPSYGKKD